MDCMGNLMPKVAGIAGLASMGMMCRRRLERSEVQNERNR